jgi:hypothetical protein
MMMDKSSASFKELGPECESFSLGWYGLPQCFMEFCAFLSGVAKMPS